MRGRIFRAVVELRREGGQNYWEIQDSAVHRTVAIVRRLIPRVAYGGRKGRRAFLRLWKMGVSSRTTSAGTGAAATGNPRTSRTPARRSRWSRSIASAGRSRRLDLREG